MTPRGIEGENIVLLFSGGVDSYCAFKWLEQSVGRHNVTFVYFDMGTLYTSKEVNFVESITPEIIVDDSLKWLGKTQKGPKAFVPFRNIYLSMRAASYGDTIVLAGVKDDQVNDKNEAAFFDFSAFLSRYSNGRKIQVMSPFWEMTKTQVVEWYLSTARDDKDKKQKEIELTNTVACYSKSETTYCGRCPCCYRKATALLDNGIELKWNNPSLAKAYYEDLSKYNSVRQESIKNFYLHHYPNGVKDEKSSYDW